jgi:hypothetical protein
MRWIGALVVWLAACAGTAGLERMDGASDATADLDQEQDDGQADQEVEAAMDPDARDAVRLRDVRGPDGDAGADGAGEIAAPVATACDEFEQHLVPLWSCIKITGRFEVRSPLLECDEQQPAIRCATVTNVNQCSQINPPACTGDRLAIWIRATDDFGYQIAAGTTPGGFCSIPCD